MIKTLLGDNWQTTATGITMITGAIVHLVYQIRAKTVTETDWGIAIGAILGGIGFIRSRDASAAKKQVADLQSRLDAHDDLLKTDTTQLKKTDVPNPT